MTARKKKRLCHLARTEAHLVSLCGIRFDARTRYLTLEALVADPASAQGERLCGACVTRFHRIREPQRGLRAKSELVGVIAARAGEAPATTA